jgi:hypothetical protein
MWDNNNFDPVLELFNAILGTPEGKAIRDKILEKKISEEKET